MMVSLWKSCCDAGACPLSINISLTSKQGKRVFIKDITYYLVPPDQQPARIAPSLMPKRRGIGTNGVTNGVNGHANGDKAPFPYPTEGEAGNPTIVPRTLLEQFHLTFLIRDPHSSIPSYYRCCIPPLDKMTGFYEFYPNEAGYDELRRFFDYAKDSALVGNKVTGRANGVVNGHADKPEICMIDADDLLDDPEGILRVYCKSVGLEFNQDMLNWDNEEDQHRAKAAFEKWKGFHEDAIDSKDLKPRAHVRLLRLPPCFCFCHCPDETRSNQGQKKHAKTEAQWDAEWKEKYGEEAAKVIRDTVDKNMADYLYLKQFVLKA